MRVSIPPRKVFEQSSSEELRCPGRVSIPPRKVFESLGNPDREGVSYMFPFLQGRFLRNRRGFLVDVIPEFPFLQGRFLSIARKAETSVWRAVSIPPRKVFEDLRNSPWRCRRPRVSIPPRKVFEPLQGRGIRRRWQFPFLQGRFLSLADLDLRRLGFRFHSSKEGF